jgi:predicted nucleic acid-binding protein
MAATASVRTAMRAEPFIDTNVLVYALSLDPARGETAKAIVARGGVISVQVANEFIDVSRRKLRWAWEDVLAALDAIRGVLGKPVPLTDETHQLAVDISRRYRLSIYDGLILSAAKHARCDVLYTEDLQSGQTIEGVLVRNPFAQT